MSPAACTEMLQSTCSDKGFTVCMVSESKLRETVKSRLQRLQADCNTTKNEEAIHEDDGGGGGGNGETPFSSATFQQSQEFKFPKITRPTGQSKQKLKAWLEEHQHNPYPTTRTKAWLSEITGMTIKQVSTWFMNARARMGLVQKVKRGHHPCGGDMATKKAAESYSNPFPHDRPAGIEYYLPTANTYNGPFVEKEGGGGTGGEEEQCDAGSSTESSDRGSNNGTESSVNGDTAVNHQDIGTKREARERGGARCGIRKKKGSSYEELAEGDMVECVEDDQPLLEEQDDAEHYVCSPTKRRTLSQSSIDTEVDFCIETPEGEGETARPPKRRRINPWERAVCTLPLFRFVLLHIFVLSSVYDH